MGNKITGEMIVEIMKKNLEFPFIGSAPGVEFSHGSDEYLNITINCRRSKNINDIVDLILNNVDGDILEIGALTGTSTRVLCESAKRKNRIVHVIDPWDGREAGDDGMYQMFLARTSSYNNLKVLKVSSTSSEAAEYIKNLKLSFCLVDGLHTYDYAMSDLKVAEESISDSGVICLDDINIPEVKRAAVDFCSSSNWRLLEIDSHIESFLLRE